MNLDQANQMANLKLPIPALKAQRVQTKTARQVAAFVLDRCEANGYPYKHHTPKSWARKFLDSKEFRLMEISINAAASPHKPRDPKRVAHYLKCAAGTTVDDPIVVDINKRKEGSTLLGYIPQVIIQDGKHRTQARLMQGHQTIMAWVGVKAIKKGIRAASELIHRPITTRKSTHDLTFVEKGNIKASFELYAATTPSVGMSVPRQDVGEGGPRSKGEVFSGKKKKLKAGRTDDCNACGARSTGQLDEETASDEKVPPDQSDAGQRVDPSDRRKWLGDKQNNFAPGTGPGYVDTFGSPNFQAPGAGSGPRVTNKGASKSEFNRAIKADGGQIPLSKPPVVRSKPPVPGMREKPVRPGTAGAKGVNRKLHNPKGLEAGKRVSKIFDEDDVMAVAPPGREDQVMELKKKFPKGSGAPFAIAWDSKNRSKKNRK